MGDIYENIRHVAKDLMKVLDGEHMQGASLVAAANRKYGVQGASLVAAAKGKYGVQRSVVQQEKLYDRAYLPFWGTCFYDHFLVQAQGQRQANRL